jgi:vacuolar-type H+-ATPase subunit H
MNSGRDADELANQAADAVRRVVAEAEERAAEILRQAESDASLIRADAEADPRARGG